MELPRDGDRARVEDPPLRVHRDDDAVGDDQVRLLRG